MKNIKYLLILFLAVSFFSCDDDDIVKLNDSEYTPATSIEGLGTNLAISKDKKADNIVVSYTPASYGVPIEATHKLQFSTTTEFSNPVTFDVNASDNAFTFTVGALNEFLTETLTLPVDEEASLSARIITYSLSGVDTLYSSPVNFTTTPYLDILFAENTFYLFGDGVGRIAQNNKLKLYKVHSEEDNWIIVWMEAKGTFKLTSDENYKGVIGKIGEPENGEYTLGTVDNRGEDIPVPGGTAGYYTVGVDLTNNKLLIEPANVYITGPNAGGVWPSDSQTEDNKFQVDAVNKTMFLTKNLSGGELRLHVTHPYIGDWWHAEFILRNGIIEYREDGGDQEPRVEINGGNQTIELDFINHTGKIR